MRFQRRMDALHSREHRVVFSMKINGYYKGIVFSELTYH